jgi:hypothetical protein
MTDHRVTCFYGKQDTNNQIENTQEFGEDKGVKFAKITSHGQQASDSSLL